MKKYLITAAMAVAVSGTFVSCHDDEITGSTVEQKIQAFEDIFTQAFGKPAPNHTFGFGDPIVLEGVTRSINVNGNQWKDCPTVGTTEEADVLAYLEGLQTKEKNPVRLQNYFVTQIHKGTETYYNQDNGYVGVGSDKMNNLHIAMSSTVTINNGVLSAEGATAWDHINNFNAGNCTDWSGGDDGHGNTLVLNGGTYDFAYHGADDSKYHNRWCSIDGKDVPKTGGGNYAGYYYICFDFEQNVDGKTAAYFRDENNDPHNIEIPGAYSSVAEATGQKFTYNGKEYVFGQSANCSEWRVDNVINGNMIVNPNSSYKDWIIRLVKAEPESIPQVKVVSGSITTDGYVTRKIVSGEKVMKSGRVFCEDIVSAKYALEDLDYNDVVYDAAIINNYRKLVTTYLDNDRNPIVFENGDPNPKIEYNFDISGQANGYNSLYAIVRLLAAGGTLPIEIKVPGQYNADVHNVLGQTSTTIMINTLDEGEREKVNMAAVVSPVPAEDLEKATGDEREKFYNVNDLDNGIELNVEYGNLAAGIRSKYYDGQTGEVVASAKYMVPLGTPWAKERVNIAEAYPKFNAWIADESVKFWDYPSNDPSKFYNDNTNTIVGLDPVKYAEGNIISNNGEEEVTDLGEEEMTSSSYTESFEPATNTLMATPTGTPIYDYSTNGYGYLYDGGYVIATSSTSITAGSKIRVYGVSIDDWEVTCVNKRKTQSNTSDYTSNGYVEFDVTGNWGRSLVIQGKNFTITYVTVVEPTPIPTTKPGQFWPSDGSNGNATSMFSLNNETMNAALSSASASNKICIYCTIGEGSWIKLNRADWGAWTSTDISSSWSIVSNNASELEPANGLGSVYNQTKGCIELQLSSQLIQEIKSYGFGMNFGNGNMTITNITVE